MSYKLFSVDDHLLEPPDLWTSRMPSKHREACMRLVRHDGVDVWSYEGQSAGTFKMFATARPPLTCCSPMSDYRWTLLDFSRRIGNPLIHHTD